MNHQNEDVEMVEVNVTFLFAAPAAIRVEDADGKPMWIPKKEIASGYEDGDFSRNDSLTLTIPEWLAVDRGLI